MKLSEAFPSKWMKSEDLTADTQMTIRSVSMEWVGSDKDGEEKLVVEFTETPKLLVLNKTNAATIADVVGDDDTDNWRGKRITLYPTRTEFGGKRVPCIRVRDIVAAVADTPADTPDEDVPF